MLIDCPFCAGRADIIIKQGSWGYDRDSGHVECDKCHAKSRTISNDERELLIFDLELAWNTRIGVDGKTSERWEK